MTSSAGGLSGSRVGPAFRQRVSSRRAMAYCALDSIHGSLDPGAVDALSPTTQSRSLERMRDEFRGDHERTQRAVEERFVAPGGVGWERYRDLLASLFGLYAPLEDRLAPAVGRHVPRLPDRSRSGRLRRDLRTLGMRPDQIEGLPTIAEAELPRLPGRTSTLGCLYVVEGAQLGHRVLWRRLRDALQESARAADAFFGVRADRARERWRRFRELFERWDSPGSPPREAVDTARTTFRAYRQWLS